MACVRVRVRIVERDRRGTALPQGVRRRQPTECWSADVSYPPACRVVRVLFRERPTYEALLNPDGRCVRDAWGEARREVMRSSEVALPPPLVSGDPQTARSSAPFGTSA